MVSTYATLVNQKVVIPSRRTQYVVVDKNHFVDFLRPVLLDIHFDEAWYVRSNPDIAGAVEDGIFVDAKHHYVTCGYYEHRMPYEIVVDEAWYLNQYPDVRDAVEKGYIVGAKDHFYTVGYQEGRLPHANFALLEARREKADKALPGSENRIGRPASYQATLA